MQNKRNSRRNYDSTLHVASVKKNAECLYEQKKLLQYDVCKTLNDKINQINQQYIIQFFFHIYQSDKIKNSQFKNAEKIN